MVKKYCNILVIMVLFFQSLHAARADRGDLFIGDTTDPVGDLPTDPIRLPSEQGPAEGIFYDNIPVDPDYDIPIVVGTYDGSLVSGINPIISDVDFPVENSDPAQTTATAIAFADALIQALPSMHADQVSPEQQSLDAAFKTIRQQLQAIKDGLKTDPKSSQTKLSKPLLGLIAKTEKQIETFKLDKEEKKQLQEMLDHVKKALDTLIVKSFQSVSQKPTQGSGSSRPKGGTQVLVRNTLLDEKSRFPDQVVLAHKGEELKRYVRGILRGFPDVYCPLRGVIMHDNGSLRTLYQNPPAKSFIRRLFNMLQTPDGYYLDDQVNITGQRGNPVRGLSPKILGKLLSMIDGDVKLTALHHIAFPKGVADENQKNDFLLLWHAEYKKQFTSEELLTKGAVPLNDFATFRKNAREFLREVYDYALFEKGNVQKSRDLLLSYLALRMDETLGDRLEMLQDYAQGLGTTFSSVGYYTQGDFNSLKSIFGTRLLTQEEALHYIEAGIFFGQCSSRGNAESNVREKLYFSPMQPVSYEGISFTACKENSLRTLVSLACYNPTKGTLDLTMLSEAVQKSLTSQFKEFIIKYSDLDDHTLDSQAAWLALVENLPGISYAREGKVDLTGPIDTAVAVLKHIFGVADVGVGDGTEQFCHLLQEINPNLIAVPVAAKAGDSFSVTRTGSDGFALQLNFIWGITHGHVFFLDSSIPRSEKEVQNLFLIGKGFGEYILGCYKANFSFLIESLVKGAFLKTEEDFSDFFKNYMSSGDISNLPDFFYQTPYWHGLELLSPDLLAPFFDAAQKMGFEFDKPFATSEIIDFFFKQAIQKRDTFLMQFLFERGLKPSVELLKLVLQRLPQNEESHNLALIKLFVDRGITGEDLFRALLDEDKPWQVYLLKALDVDINAPMYEGLTPLMIVALQGKSDFFNPLIKLGARISFKNNAGQDLCEFLIAMAHRPIDFSSTNDQHSWETQKLSGPMSKAEAQGLLNGCSMLLARYYPDNVSDSLITEEEYDGLEEAQDIVRNNLKRKKNPK